MVQTNPTATPPSVYASPHLKRLEADIAELSLVEQQLLMEWLAQRIRESSLRAAYAKDAALAAMASDPDIQRELREINAEFAVAGADGLVSVTIQQDE
jgi:hypothetical protein